MAINRVLTAIWSEISARGSLIKTATSPYRPNPGADNPNANNQGLAAISGGSPFLPLDQNGLNAEVPVATGLAAGANLSPSNSLDENSGAFHVTRQYGDIYLYNDGNVIAWGGNGKNFSFGNGYEENHAWANQPAVYNNETFRIPSGAMTSFTDANTYMLPSATPDATWEWLGGNVSKSWGNDYTYTYGSSYEWSDGPTKYVDAYGNVGADLTDVMQGKHCTFSYGTGYEESLVEWNNSCAWFHADDANSPYWNRTSDKWQSSNLGAGWTADKLLVSKAFGPTYDYHYGPTLSVQEGASEEHVNGSSWSTVTGDSNETVTGDSSSTVNGDSNETITGDQTAMIKGNALEQFWGRKSEFFMGGKSEMILGACDEITLSVKMEIKTLGAVEVFGGIAVATFLGLQIEIQAGGKIEIGELEVKNKAATVTANAAATVAVNGAASVQSSPVNVVTP
jgi:hypothetical protein